MSRPPAILVVVALLLAACSSVPSEIEEIPLDGSTTAGEASDPSTPGGTAPPNDAGTDAAGPSASPQPGDGGQPGPTGDPDATDEPPASTPATDSGPVGVNGRAILRGDRPMLVIEIDVQSGASVDQAAVDHLVAVLDDVVDKPAGIRFAGGNTFDSDRTEWTAADLRAASAANRSTATTTDQVSIHVLYVNGGHHSGGERTEAIGVAYSSSTVALFPDRWSGLTSLLGSGRAIERAVLVHEVGHLLGLVNLTYTSDIDHEDPDHPGHSRSQDSVMYHAVESTLVGQVFNGPPPDTFDLDDLADLEGLRTGRY